MEPFEGSEGSEELISGFAQGADRIENDAEVVVGDGLSQLVFGEATARKIRAVYLLGLTEAADHA
ncbi:MAG: hypothetical protein AAF604_11540 [Acidobacteriota bacterium]